MKRLRKPLYMLLMLFTVLMMSMNAQAALRLNKTQVTLIQGQTFQLKAAGISGKPTWLSKNNSIASVSKNGLVRAVAKGKTTITATFKNATCKVSVRVEEPVLSKNKAKVLSGKTFTLKLNGTTKKVKWSSSNKKVAKVSSKGVVTTNKAGTAKITAKVGNRKYVCKVTVKERSNNSSDNGSSENNSSDNGSSGNNSSDDSGSSASPGAGYVWIPRTGSKYHSISTCSGMRNPSYVPLSSAIAGGYTACSKCW